MDRFINVQLISHPVNWVVVLAMVAFGALAFHLLYTLPASQQG